MGPRKNYIMQLIALQHVDLETIMSRSCPWEMWQLPTTRPRGDEARPQRRNSGACFRRNGEIVGTDRALPTMILDELNT
jgi:hypothetical protein